MPIGLLSSAAKPLAILAVIGLLFGYRALLIHQRDAARAQVATLTLELAATTAANQAMKSAVARQNAAVAALTAAAAVAERQAAAQTAEAARSGAEIMRQESARAAALGRAAVPDGCAGAIAWGNAQGPELGRW
jgi:hypothetical protein